VKTCCIRATVLLALMFSGVLRPQESVSYASISGQVIDPSGARRGGARDCARDRYESDERHRH
jgi:hypothetical protein